MHDIALQSDRTSIAKLSAVAALVAVTAWAAVQFAPGTLALVVALIVCGVVAALAFRAPEVALVAFVGASTLDVMGRIASLGPLRITLSQVVIAAALALAISRIRARRSPLVRTPLDLPVFAFVVIAAASVLVAAEPARAIVAVISLASSVLFAYLVVLFAGRREALVRVLLGVLALGSVFAVLAILERHEFFSVGTPIYKWGIGIRPKVTFDDPNMLGLFLMVSSMLALPLAWTIRHRFARPAILGAVALCVLAVYETGSRGALGGVVVALIVMIAAARVPLERKITIALVGFAVVFAALLGGVGSGWMESRLSGIREDNSALARVYMAQSAAAMVADHPFGVGAANYPVVYPFYRDASVRSTLVESHTMVLTVLVEYGFVGLVLLVWVLWRFLSRTWITVREAGDPLVRAAALGGLAAGTGAIAQSFTYSLETNKFLWLTVGIGIAAYVAWQRTIEEEQSCPKHPTGPTA